MLGAHYCRSRTYRSVREIALHEHQLVLHSTLQLFAVHCDHINLGEIKWRIRKNNVGTIKITSKTSD